MSYDPEPHKIKTTAADCESCNAEAEVQAMADKTQVVDRAASTEASCQRGTTLPTPIDMRCGQLDSLSPRVTPPSAVTSQIQGLVSMNGKLRDHKSQARS